MKKDSMKTVLRTGKRKMVNTAVMFDPYLEGSVPNASGERKSDKSQSTRVNLYGPG
jgi:hypothetical protein